MTPAFGTIYKMLTWFGVLKAASAIEMNESLVEVVGKVEEPTYRELNQPKRIIIKGNLFGPFRRIPPFRPAFSKFRVFTSLGMSYHEVIVDPNIRWLGGLPNDTQLGRLRRTGSSSATPQC